MADYKLTQHASIIRTLDGACIPADPANGDFKQYLRWRDGWTEISPDGSIVVHAPNTPDPADPGVVPPLSCNAAQIRLALNQLTLRSAVEAAVAASTDLNLKDLWQYSPNFKENDANIIAMATAIGVDAAGLHGLFELAVTL